MKDGWHKIHGYDVYVENDRVSRGMSMGNGTVTVYPYKKSRYGGWDRVSDVLYATLYQGLDLGNYILR